MDKERIELITKVVTALGAILAGIAIPIVINLNAERNRQSQLYVQIMSQREQSDSGLRQKMFGDLITSYLGKGVENDPEKQIMYLYLLSLNFQEFFDAKPLFEDLDRKLKGRDLARLQDIAREISSRQINLLTRPGKEATELTLCLKAREDCESMSAFKVTGRTRSYLFNIEMLDVGASDVGVRVSLSPDEAAGERVAFKPIEFDVSYYDMPFMSNTRLMDGTRFALVLKYIDSKAQAAVLRVVTFPEEYMSLRDRPYFDEMLLKIGSSEKTAGRVFKNGK